jgi:hypothetical protein
MQQQDGKKLHDEDLNNLHSSWNIIGVIKPSKLR